MRRTLMAATVAAALAVTAGSALAAPRMAPFSASGHAAEQVQYYPDWHARRDWDERRWHLREQRRAYDEERIAEAARREAWRIERERAERRAWRHAQRERHWHHNGF
ncbi:MAG TPA: hypothetical protein VEX11_13960 [Acetobacteraceae bacterium]|nr:hypothetical protein [Acetobacteraceae bacterium]